MRVCRWSSKRGWMKSVGRCFLRRSRQLRWEYWAGWVRSWQSQVFSAWRHIRISKRLRELGLRVALGAQRKQILKAALGTAFRLLAFGSAAGLMLGMLASRVLSDIVYRATPRDPAVLAGVVLAMVMLGLVATWIPARRALSVDPMILLREE